MPSTQNFYTTSGAAKYLGVSTSRVRQFAQEGRIGQRLGGAWMFTASELAAFRRRKRAPGNPNNSKKMRS